MVAKSTFLLILFTIDFQSTNQETIGTNITYFQIEDSTCFLEQDHNMVIIRCSSKWSKADTLFFIICDEPKVLNLNKGRGISYVEGIDVKKCSVPANSSVPEKHVTMNFNSFVYRANVENSLRSSFFIGWTELEVLRLTDNQITHLEEDVFKLLLNIKELYLNRNKLKKISRNLFRNLTHLEVLDLSNNELMTVEPGTFLHQRKMERLILQKNQLQNLEKEMFNGLISLTDLNILNNNLTIFRGDIFEHIPKLRVLDLEDKVNAIDLQEGLFKSNKHLSRLTIRAPHSKFPTGFLSHLPELSFLDITGIKMKNIPVDLLNGSAYIQYFALTRSQINLVPANLFCNQRDMEWLDLSSNEINHLEDGVLNGLTKLLHLWLQNNNLVNISRTIFCGLDSLKTIDLRNNKLAMIHCEAFDNTKNLESMYVENNELSFNGCESKSPFTNLGKLRILNLNYNKVTTILPHLKELPNLSLLHLDANQISTLKMEDLLFKSNNVTVYIRNNFISKLRVLDNFDDPNIFGKNEVNLYLTNDKFPLTAEVYRIFQRGLKNFRMETQLRENEYDFENLNCNFPLSVLAYKKLVDYVAVLRCAVDKSKIECPLHCECEMYPYSNNLTIDCSNANLSYMPKFEDYQKSYFRAIELYIGHNNITELDSLPPNLKVLDVSHNKIRVLNEEAVNMLNKLELKSISMGNNNWLCDCSSEAKNFATFIDRNSKIITDPSDAKKCESKSGAVTDLSPEYEQNCSQRLRNIYLMVIICFGFFIGILIVIYLKYQQEIKIWLYWHNLCLWWIDEEMLDMDKKYDAFISYSHHDVDFAIDTIVNNLENGNPRFKICVGERDWIAGETILELIKASVSVSRRTIVILTRNYLQSVWGQYEFFYAHQQGIVEKRNRVIVIIYGDIGETENMDPTLKSYLNTNTYIKWGEAWFWRKLRYSLQHSYKARVL